MQNSYDVAVVGAGAAGSSAAYHLSKTGKRILVLDRFTPPHNFGSSHGRTRIIREAYFEDPVYVPLVQQSYHLWHQLEQESNKKLLIKTGGLMLGTHGSKVIRGAIKSAIEYHLPYEYLDSGEIKKRFAGLCPRAETVGVYEQNAGILFPEECIRTHLELASNPSVHFSFNQVVTNITSKDSGAIEIRTDKEKHLAAKVIVSAGPWLSQLLPELQLPLVVSRQLLFWFKCKEEDAKKYLAENFPVYIWQVDPEKIFYGFPDLGEGIKIAIHHGGERAMPDLIDRTVRREEISEISAIVQTYLGIEASYSHSAVCMYTNTPDEDFIIDHHPFNKNIIVASPCSGHGFKFSSAIGKLLCDMTLEKPLDFDLSKFALKRFGKGLSTR